MSFEEQLGQAITKALGWFLDTAFLTGNGASAPAGVINSPATICYGANAAFRARIDLAAAYVRSSQP